MEDEVRFSCFYLCDHIPLCTVGMVKQPSEHSSEFQMSNEDFPALPGAPVRSVLGFRHGFINILKIRLPYCGYFRTIDSSVVWIRN
jgi:hypothetical protein